MNIRGSKVTAATAEKSPSRRRARALMLVASVQCAVFAACSAPTPSIGPACVPREQRPCGCANGRAGFQRCDESGDEFSECNCSPADAASEQAHVDGSDPGAPDSTIQTDAELDALAESSADVASETAISDAADASADSGKDAAPDAINDAPSDATPDSNVTAIGDASYACGTGDAGLPLSDAGARGSTVWSTAFPLHGEQVLPAVARHGEDFVFAAGELSRRTANNSVVWTTSVAAPRAHVAVDYDGNVLLAGAVHEADAGPGLADDAWIAKRNGDGAPVWQFTYGQSGNYQDANYVAADSSGNVIAAGRFQGTIDFGAGPITAGAPGPGFSGYVAMFDPGGVVKWNRRFDRAPSGTAAASNRAGRTAVWSEVIDNTYDSNGGGSPGSARLEVLNPNGATLWSRSIVGTPSIYEVVTAVDDCGGVLTCAPISNFGGDFGGGVVPGNIDNGHSKVAFARYDASGAFVWAKVFGGYDWGGITSELACTAIRFAPDGSFYAAGYFDGQIDFGNGVLTGMHPSHLASAWLAHFDAEGNAVWSRGFANAPYYADGGPAWGGIGFTDLTLTSSGTVVASGSFGNRVDFGKGELTAANILDVFLLAVAR